MLHRVYFVCMYYVEKKITTKPRARGLNAPLFFHSISLSHALSLSVSPMLCGSPLCRSCLLSLRSHVFYPRDGVSHVSRHQIQFSLQSRVYWLSSITCSIHFETLSLSLSLTLSVYLHPFGKLFARHCRQQFKPYNTQPHAHSFECTTNVSCNANCLHV